ncbi:transcriptional regulator [Streptomyces sp. URMC 123]|uniref:transcriptional regulator n=1 Tax=Streptomyces sp. URMC 123 TaxID=3423403 RepID=UPI003F19DA95
MPRTAQDALDDAVRALAPDAGANRFLPLVTTGRAPLHALAALAAEQHLVIGSDRRSFAHLAGRSADPSAAAFFAALADGEDVALRELARFATACGLDGAALAAYEPRAGCQAYPAYAAWLALQAEPADVVIALTANFAAWGGYCRAMADALRRGYGLDDAACGFFDFFAAPAPEIGRLALAAVATGLERGTVSEAAAQRYGRLLQSYELMFWNTLADAAG